MHDLYNCLIRIQCQVAYGELVRPTPCIFSYATYQSDPFPSVTSGTTFLNLMALLRDPLLLQHYQKETKIWKGSLYGIYIIMPYLRHCSLSLSLSPTPS